MAECVADFASCLVVAIIAVTVPEVVTTVFVAGVVLAVTADPAFKLAAEGFVP